MPAIFEESQGTGFPVKERWGKNYKRSMNQGRFEFQSLAIHGMAFGR